MPKRRVAPSLATVNALPAEKKRKQGHSPDDDVSESGTNIIEQANALDGAAFNKRYLENDSLYHAGKDGMSFGSATATDIDPAVLVACFDLIALTSRPDYEASSLGWHPRRKQSEMRGPDMRYFFVGGPVESEGPVAGFLSYMLTHDSTPSVPVLYVYEIHLNDDSRGRGLGKWLMTWAETLAERVGVEKVMLTCFLSNTKARRFYERLGYVTDEDSPADRKIRSKIVKADYVILSKRLSKLAQTSG